VLSRYIHLVKLSKMMDEKTEQMDARDLVQHVETRELEERLPLRALVIFRHAAAREMQNEARARQQQALAAEDKARRAATRAAGGKGTWWGWLGGLEKETRARADSIGGAAGADGHGHGHGEGSTAASEGNEAADEEDVSIASIIASLERQQQQEETAGSTSATLFRLALQTSASIDTFVMGQPVASATGALKVLMEVTTFGVVTSAFMKDVVVVDRCDHRRLFGSLTDALMFVSRMSTRQVHAHPADTDRPRRQAWSPQQ